MDNSKFRQHEMAVVDQLVRGNNKTLIDQIEAVKFDAGFSTILWFETLVNKAIGLPVIRWGSSVSDPFITMFNRNPWDHSTTLPLMHPSVNLLHKFGHRSLYHRLVYQVVPFAMTFMLDHIALNPSRFDNERSLKAYTDFH